MESAIVNTKGVAKVSTDHVSTYEPKIYVGSAGICFLAETLAIDAEMLIKNVQSKMQIESGKATMSAALGASKASENAGNREADVISLNAKEQISSAVASGVQAGSAVTGVLNEARIGGASAKMSNISDELQNHKLSTAGNGVGDLAPANRTAEINEYKDLLINAKSGGRGLGAETYESISERARKSGKNPLDVEIKEGEGITLRHVLNSSDAADLALMKNGMKSESETYDKHLDSRRKSFDFKRSAMDSLTQSFTTGVQSNFKTNEATATREKAQQSAIQAMQQAVSQNLSSIASRQADASNQAFQAAQSGWSTISQMVQVDTRA
jgi:hypothetical protein